MKHVLTFGIALLPFVGTAVADVELSEKSLAVAQIVLPDNPAAVERTAARELKTHLDAMTGGNFKIVGFSERDKSAAAVFVGDSPATREISGVADFSKLGYDAIAMKSDGEKNVALCGHPERGTLYAVYTFLEDFGGVRWWSKNETHIPRKPDFSVGKFDISYAPVFKLREALYKVGFDGVFASRLRQNGATLTRMNFDRPVIAPEYGGCQSMVLFKGRGSAFHSHFEIIPPKVYFEKHPEWFSLIDGKRTWKGAQLCLTNGAMAAEYLKNVKKLLRENPLATSIQVSQNDWSNPCRCTKCAAIDNENGSHAGTNIYFANKIAEGIESEFPNVHIDTFAYQYTRKTPSKIRPRKNVLVRLCTIECSFLRPLDSGNPLNEAFVRDMKEWAKITKNLFIWDYVTNFRSYMMPCPNLNALAPNLRFFAENSAAGVFEQGDAFCSAGDFVLMRNWVISHLMWNPYADEKKLFAEFLNGYYGEEVGAIFGKYLATLQAAADKTDVSLGCFFEYVPAWFDAQTYNTAAKLLDEAVAAAKKLESENPEKYAGLLRKVRRERLSFDHMTVAFYHQLKSRAEREGGKINLPKAPAAALENLIAEWKDLKVETWREFTTPAQFEAYQNNLRANLKKVLALEEIAKGIPPQKGVFRLADIKKTNAKTYCDSAADTVADPAAQGGRATLVPPSGSGEQIKFELDAKDLDFGGADEKTVSFFAKLRADAKGIKPETTIGAFVVRILWNNLLKTPIKTGDIAGESYREIKLGEVKILRHQLPITVVFASSFGKDRAQIYLESFGAR